MDYPTVTERYIPLDTASEVRESDGVGIQTSLLNTLRSEAGANDHDDPASFITARRQQPAGNADGQDFNSAATILIQ